jgi:hypothetical protein
MSTKNKAPSGQPWRVDELGVITWAPDTDPMVEVVQAMRPSLEGNVTVPAKLALDASTQLAVRQVHVTLGLARSIAVSLFGTEWGDYVMDVYDRIKDARDDFDHADDE